MIDRNSQFMAILTNVGAAKLANANALGIPWNLTALGVGDANGTDPIPSATQTRLINEQRRAPLNQLRVDPLNSAVIIAEQVIPADVGGWWIREIGLYDSDGDLVAVSNCAPSFKPALDQGSGRTQIVRMNFIVSSTNNIVLKIDPAVVLATREYVDLAITEAVNRQDFKHSVLVATTAAIALNGLQTIDGVAVVESNRVLVKNQAQGRANGIYLVANGAWVRSQDADASVEVTPGLIVHVEKGADNGDSVWQLVTDAPVVLGTTALVFEMVAGRTGVSAGGYTNVTVDKYGRVIAGTNPSTLAGHGITDTFTKDQITELVAALADEVGRARSLHIQGAYRGILLSANGVSSSISARVDQVIVKDSSGGTRRLSELSAFVRLAAVGVNGLDMGTLAASSFYSLWAISGVSQAFVAALCPVLVGATTAGSAVVAGLPTTTSLRVGMPLSSPAFPAGTVVQSIDSPSQINASALALTTNVSAALRFVYDPVLPAGYTSKARVGMFLTGANSIPYAYTQVDSVLLFDPTAGSNTVNYLVAVTGVASSPVSVSLANLVPPTARKVSLVCGSGGGYVGFAPEGAFASTPGNGYLSPAQLNGFPFAGGYNASGPVPTAQGDFILRRMSFQYCATAALAVAQVMGWEDSL